MASNDVFLILNPVRTELADQFEAFVNDILGPAVAAHQPELSGRVRLWRATEPEPGAQAITIYAFVAQGVSSWEDLDLLPAFTEHFGADGAQRHLADFNDFFVDHQTWMTAWTRAWTEEGGGDDVARQYGWQMQELPTYLDAHP